MANRDFQDDQYRYGQQSGRGRSDRYRSEESEWEDERGGGRSGGREEAPSQSRDDEYTFGRHGRMSGYGERGRGWSEGGRPGERGGYGERRSWGGSWGRPQNEGYGERGYGERELGGERGYGSSGDWGFGSEYGYRGQSEHYGRRGIGRERGGWSGVQGGGYSGQGGRYGSGYETGSSGRGYGSYDELDEYGDHSRGSMGERWPRSRFTGRIGGMTGRFIGRGPKGYERSDERIREDVCDRLMDDAEIDASRLTVVVTAGEVTLEGSVDSKQAKRIAEDIAEEVSGVRDVQNRLKVEPDTSAQGESFGGRSGGGVAGMDSLWPSKRSS